MKCQHCGESLLHNPAYAGSPSRPYWVTSEGGALGFHCSASTDGRHEPTPRVHDNSPRWWLLPRRWWPGNWNYGWPT